MRPQKMTAGLFLMGALLAALVAFSAQMCLNDAFSLGADRTILLAVAVFAALASAALLFLRKLWPSLAVLVLVLGAVLWFRVALLESLCGVLYTISESYAQCYAGVKILGQPGGDPTAILSLLALPLAWITAWAVCREGSTMAVALACAPFLIVCLVIVDVAPVFWLILLTGVLLVLLLSHSVRAGSSSEGSRLAWWLVLPTVILVSAVTILWPPADYVRPSWSDALQTLAEAKISIQRLGTTILYSGPGWNASLRSVDLAQLGPRPDTGREVLTYRASSEIDYLRGVSLGVYEDNTWSAVRQSAYTAQTFDPQPQLQVGLARPVRQQLEVSTRTVAPVLYTAYDLDAIPGAGQAVDDAYIQNHTSATSYQLTYRTGTADPQPSDTAYTEYVRAQYLQVPEALRSALEDLLSEEGLYGSSPAAIADWVRNLAVYDLETPRLPEGEDFVLYFLTQSRQGYCVHFATATAMLLRTLGIPARYVTGYAVSGAANEYHTVTEDNAHAWVEYYDATLGWLPLDPTPAVGSGSETTEPVEPDLPDEETTPDEPDKPEPSDQDEPVEPAPDLPDQPDTPESSDNPDASAPEASEPQAPASPPMDPRWLWLLAVPGFIGLVYLRRFLVLKGRRDRCRRGHPNRRALTLWRWLCHLAKAEEIALPEELFNLAEKARFSQHTLTEEELQQLEQARDAAITRLKQRPWHTQFWNRYGKVLY